MTQRRYVNPAGGAQAPREGGGLHLGKVVSVSSTGRANVNIPSFSTIVPNLDFLGVTAANRLTIGDSVVVAFLDNDVFNAVIIGRINTTTDVFATQAALAALTARVVFLESRDHTH